MITIKAMSNVPGKLEVVIKINQLPTSVTTDKNGWKAFVINCGGRNVSVKLRPRMWIKLEEWSKAHEFWIASIAGVMGPSHGQDFALLEPNLQVFERKPPASAAPPEQGSEPAPQT